jgi:phage shock protein A
MGVWQRMTLGWKERLKDWLAPAEDPRQTFAGADQRQRQLLLKVRRSVQALAASKQQLAIQGEETRAQLLQLETQASRALSLGREDLARLALQQHQLAVLELRSLDEQARELQQKELRLSLIQQRLLSQLETFQARQTMMAARYTAAEAQTHIGEALTELSRELADLGLALERAEQKTEHMQARAAAMDDWVDASLSETQSLPIGDRVDRQLMQFDLTQAVEEQLAVLKRQLSTPTNGNCQNEGNA